MAVMECPVNHFFTALVEGKTHPMWSLPLSLPNVHHIYSLNEVRVYKFGPLVQHQR